MTTNEIKCGGPLTMKEWIAKKRTMGPEVLEKRRDWELDIMKRRFQDETGCSGEKLVEVLEGIKEHYNGDSISDSYCCAFHSNYTGTDNGKQKDESGVGRAPQADTT